MFYLYFCFMYLTLLVIHSFFRWAALAFLVYSLYRAFTGYRSKTIFSPADNAFRHWTATVLQVQMMIGFVLYSYSPFVKSGDQFFSIIHAVLMFIAVVIVSFGSAFAKRKSTDEEKFRTMLTWFSVCLLVIIIAIPWPFSPFAQRPYLRLP